MIVNAYGDEAVFEATDVDIPNVGYGHVLVSIAASRRRLVDVQRTELLGVTASSTIIAA